MDFHFSCAHTFTVLLWKRLRFDEQAIFVTAFLGRSEFVGHLVLFRGRTRQ